MDHIYHKLCEIAGADAVKEQESMKLHTTFRIGGPAEYFVCPTAPEQVRDILRFCREEEIPWFLFGNGSNLLVSDAGIPGVVIQLDQRFRQAERTDRGFRAQAGILLSGLAVMARKASLTGMEFAAGIPGTLGGATAMNAGAYGGEMKDILRTVRIIDQDLELRELPVSELALGYRTSRIKKENLIVLEAEISLQNGEPDKISARMDELREARVSKQPLEFPSAGSTFKRPEGNYAGKLIMEAGLRGFRIGDAQVAEKHCGFVINRGQASAEDVRRLMREVQKRVLETSGVLLEPEIRMIGFDDPNII